MKNIIIKRKICNLLKKSKINPISKDNYVFSNQDNNFVLWTERLWLDHDQILNRIDRNLNSMLRQGMRAQDIAEKLFPGNAKSMRMITYLKL